MPKIVMRKIPNERMLEKYFDTSIDEDEYKRTGKANPALKKALAEEKKIVKGKMTTLKQNVVEKRLDLKVAIEKVDKFQNEVDSFNPPRVLTEKQKLAAKKTADAKEAKAKREADRIVKKAKIERLKQEKKDEKIQMMTQREQMKVEDKASKALRVKKPRAKSTETKRAKSTETKRVKLTDEQKKENRLDAMINREDNKLEAARKFSERIIAIPTKETAAAARLRRAEYLAALRKYRG